MNLRQLAKLADLSAAAVSLALRGSERISPDTRARVRELARKHNYQPDAGIVEMMKRIRRPLAVRQQACFAVISLYDTPRPWEASRHWSLIHAGMTARASELGYRLEPIWLRAEGMTHRRIRNILDTRGIQGLISVGGPDIDQEFPALLDHYAIVTIGVSIRSPLHRVATHHFKDTVAVLDEILRRGYQRPGLVLGRYDDDRGAHAHVSAYLGWCERHFGLPRALPVLRLDGVEERPLLEWLTRERPDVILFVHHYDQIPNLRTVLQRNKIHVPRDLGVAVLSQLIENTGFSGMQQNQMLMGAWAVELLAARITNNDFGIPQNPREEMVESRWLEGISLRPAPTGSVKTS